MRSTEHIALATFKYLRRLQSLMPEDRVKRIPAKPPKVRRGGGITDVANKGKGWHREPSRHSLAARGMTTRGPPRVRKAPPLPTDFYQYVAFVQKKFPSIKADIADQIREIEPGIYVADVALTGSYARGTPTEASDIDLLVTYVGPIDELGLNERLAGKIHGFGQIFDVVVKRL